AQRSMDDDFSEQLSPRRRRRYHVAAKGGGWPARASSLRRLGIKRKRHGNEEKRNTDREPGPEGGAGGAKGEDNATTHSNGSKPGPAARRGALRGREGRSASGRGRLRQEDQPRGLSGRKGHRRTGNGGCPDR